MNVYFAGGEDTDFTVFGGVAWSTTSSRLRPSYARIAAQIQNSVAADPPAIRIRSAQFTAVSTLWAHATVFFNGNVTVSNSHFWRWLDSGGVCRLVLRGTGTASQLKLSTRNAAGSFTDVATFSSVWVNNTLNILDCAINYSASGTFSLYVNGTQVGSTYSGDLTTDGNSTLAQMEMADTITGGQIHWSEMVVADSDTRLAGLVLLNSSTAGNAQTWSGTASNVNKSTISDATFISAASAGLINEYKVASLAAGAWAVPAVVMSSRAEGGTAGSPTQLEYANSRRNDRLHRRNMDAVVRRVRQQSQLHSSHQPRHWGCVDGGGFSGSVLQLRRRERRLKWPARKSAN